MNPSDQDSAPLAEAIRRLEPEGHTFFSIPGHKLGAAARFADESTLGRAPFALDALEQQGFDDRKSTLGAKEAAQTLAARAYRADKTVFSTGGSTLSAHVTLMSVAGPGDTVLLSRNVHLSVAVGLVLCGARPVFISPEFDPQFDLAHGLGVEAVEAAFAAHPDARALLVTSPTYYGVAPDLAALARVCHRHGSALLVDEAWGAELGFCDDLPPSAMQSGADLSFASLHKASTGLAQGSVINLKGDRVDAGRIELLMQMLRSTSESGLILASIDEARRHMATRGERDLARAVALAQRARERIARIDGFRLMGREVLGRPGAASLDPTKIVVDVSASGCTGFALCDWMRSERRVSLELAEARHVMAVVTLADDDDSIERLVAAFEDAAAAAGGLTPLPAMPFLRELDLPMAMSPREAFTAAAESVPLQEAVDRVSAEAVSPYPPGIPLVVPGERFTEPVVRYLEAGMRAGMFVSAVSDESLKTVRVVKNA